MENLIDLIVKSSFPDSQDAVKLWNEANRILPLTDWPGEISRLASCFYSNHGKDFQLENVALLKGVYKSNWVRNSLALSALITLLRQLDASEIDYRLIKGGAIILHLNSIGARRMGDLDLVINKKNRKNTQVLLRDSGFMPRYPGDRRGRTNEIWENSSGVVLDLHYVNRFHTFKFAFAELAPTIYMGYSFKLPTLESSILISAIHGELQSSNGDFYQSAWDISMLYKLADDKKLLSLAKKYGTRKELLVFIRYLNGLRYSLDCKYFSLVRLSTFDKLRDYLLSRFKSVTNLSLPKILNFSNFRLRYFLIHWRQLTDWRYLFWGMFGMIRPLETLLASKKGLFARKKTVDFRDSITVLIKPSQFHFSGVGFEMRHIFANEFRVLIQKSNAKRMKLDLNIELENPSPRMLFINGVGYGHITPSLGSKYGFDIGPNEQRIELSFRDFSSNPIVWLGKIDLKWTPSVIE